MTAIQSSPNRFAGRKFGARHVFLSTTAIASIAVVLTAGPVITAPFGPVGLAGNLINPNGSTLDIVGTITGNGFDVNNLGTINVSGADINGIDTYTNGGSLFTATTIGDGTNARSVNADTVTNTGSLTIFNNAALNATTEVTTDSAFGQIIMNGASSITAPLVTTSGAGGVTASAGATATITGALLNSTSGFATATGSLQVTGSFVNDDGVLQVGDNGSFQAASVLNQTGALTVEGTLISDDGKVINRGNMGLGGGATAAIITGNILHRTGTLGFNGDTNVTGGLEVEAGTLTDVNFGTTTLTGNFRNEGPTNVDAGATISAPRVNNLSTGVLNVEGTVSASGDNVNNEGQILLDGAGSVTAVQAINNTAGGGTTPGLIQMDGTSNLTASNVNNEDGGQLNVLASATSTVTGNVNNNTDGVMDVAGSLAVTGNVVNNGGDLDVGDNGSLSASIIRNESGTFTSLGDVTATKVTNQATMNMGGGATAATVTGNLVNEGTGTFSADGDLTVTGNITNEDGGDFDVVAGTTAATGNVVNDGTLDVAVTTTLNGANVRNTANGTMNVSGDVGATAGDVDNTGTLNVADGASVSATGQITNAQDGGSAGRIELAGTADLTAPTVRNSDLGEIDVLAGANATITGDLANGTNGTTTVSGTLDVSGALENDGGTIDVADAGSLTAGSITNTSGNFNAQGTVTSDDGNVLNRGAMSFGGGTTAAQMNATLLNRAGSFTSNGDVGISGNVDNDPGAAFNTVSGTTTVSGGSLTNGGSVDVGAGSTLVVATLSNQSAGNVDLNGALTGTLDNSGTATAEGTLDGAIVNRNGGTLTVDGALALSGTTDVTNQGGGVLNVTGGSMTGGNALDNRGNITVTGQTLSMASIDNSGRIDLAGATAVLTSAATIQNTGIMEVEGTINGSIDNRNAANFAIIGDTTQNGDFSNLNNATFTMTGGTFTTGNFVQSSSTAINLALGRDVNAATFTNNTMSTFASNLVTSGDVTNAGMLTFDATSVSSVGADLGNTGTVSNAGDLTVTGATTNGGTLGNTGTMLLSGIVSNTGTINTSNQFTASATVTNDGTINQSGTAGFADLANNADFSNTAGTATINGQLTNAGDVSVTGGAVNVTGAGGTLNTGLIALNGGDFGTTNTLANTTGTVRVIDGTLTAGAIDNDNRLRVDAAGVVNATTIDSNGNFTNAGAVSGTSVDITGGTFDNSGSVTLTGDLSNAGTLRNLGAGTISAINVGNTGIFTNFATLNATDLNNTSGTFDNRGTAAFTGNGINNATLVNTKGMMSFGGALTSDSIVTVEDGTLQISGLFTNSAGTVDVNGGALNAGSVENSGAFTVDGGASTTVGGLFNTTGLVTVDGTLNADTFNLATGGNLNTNGTFSVTNGLTGVAGTLVNNTAIFGSGSLATAGGFTNTGGAVTIAGAAGIGEALTTTGGSFNALSLDVDGLATLNGAVTITNLADFLQNIATTVNLDVGSLLAQADFTNTGGIVNIGGAATVNGALGSTGSFSAGSLDANGLSTLSGTVTITGLADFLLAVANTANMNVGQLLAQAGFTNTGGTVNVTNAAQILGALNSSGVFSADSLDANGLATIGGTFTITNLADFLQAVANTGAFTAGSLVASNDFTNTGGTVNIVGAAQILGALSTTGAFDAGSLDVNGLATLDGPVTITNLADFLLNVAASANVSVGQLLAAADFVSTGGVVTVTGAANIGGALTTDSAFSALSLDVDGLATLNGPVTVTNLAEFLLNVATTANMTVGQLIASADFTNTGGTVAVTNAATVGGAFATDTAFSSASLAVTGAAVMSGTVDVTGASVFTTNMSNAALFTTGSLQLNGGTSSNSGTIASGTTSNASAFTNTGIFGTAAFTNTGTFTNSGAGTVTGSSLDNQGTFSLLANTATYTGAGVNSGTINIADGTTMAFGTGLNNGAAGILNLDGTLDADLTSTGTFNIDAVGSAAAASAIVTGSVDATTIDLTNGGGNGADDVLTIGDAGAVGGGSEDTMSVGGVVIDVFINNSTEQADRIVLNGTFLPGGTDTLLTFEVDPDPTVFTNVDGVEIILIENDGSGTLDPNDFAFNTKNVPDLNTSLDTSDELGSAIIFYSLGNNAAGDLTLNSQINPAIAAIAGQVATSQSLLTGVINRPSSPLITALAFDAEDNRSEGLWARAQGGVVETTSRTTNGTSNLPTTVDADYTIFQVGYDSGTFNAFDGGEDLIFGGVAGMLDASATADNFAIDPSNSTQFLIDPVTGQKVLTSTTNSDFKQVFAGGYVAYASGLFSGDVQLRFEKTDFTFDNPAIDLRDAEASSNSVTLSASGNYVYQVNDNFFIVPTGGLAITQTSTDPLTLTDAGGNPTGRLNLPDHTTTIGFVGATAGYQTIANDGTSALTRFVTATLYNDFSSDRDSIFDIVDPNSGLTTQSIAMSTENLESFGEISFGLNYVQILDEGKAGAARQLNAGIRFDTRFSDRIEAYNITAQARLQF